MSDRESYVYDVSWKIYRKSRRWNVLDIEGKNADLDRHRRMRKNRISIGGKISRIALNQRN